MPYDPQKAKQLLAEAGYPKGFDAGELVPFRRSSMVAEAVVNDSKRRGHSGEDAPMERAAFYAAWKEKKLQGPVHDRCGAVGNAATRVETFMYSKGGYAYGGYPDIDALYQKQARERDPKKRETMCTRSSR